jgi:hypothetical protein
MVANAFRAGSAAVNVDPPLGLPMVGVVRRTGAADGRIGHLEVTAAAFERGSIRVVLCGVDSAGIQSPEVDDLRDRIAQETGAQHAGILLNWNHTHQAPAGGRTMYAALNEGDPKHVDAVHAYVASLHEGIADACRLAFERLEPAWVRWGLGFADEAINRRQRDEDGMVRKIGWNPSGLADLSVPVLQSVRADGSAIATLVGYGCHTVCTPPLLSYSPDYPGPLRALIRQVTGGECVFFQGAGGNIMPRIAFDESGQSATRLGRRLAVEALHALADRPALPVRLIRTAFTSANALDLFRFEPVEDPESPALAAAEEIAGFPLQPLPPLRQVEEELAKAEAELRAAEARGADDGELRVLRYFGVNHWRRVQAEYASGSPRTSVPGPICAVRVGDGAIVSGPGEIFTEIGMAVKERSPADVTLYAGYTNGAVSYMPIAAEYPLGGYEPGYGNKSYGLPSQVAPTTERVLVETGVRLVRSLFPERSPRGPEGWLATGTLPDPPPPLRLTRPA